METFYILTENSTGNILEPPRRTDTFTPGGGETVRSSIRQEVFYAWGCYRWVTSDFVVYTPAKPPEKIIVDGSDMGVGLTAVQTEWSTGVITVLLSGSGTDIGYALGKATLPWDYESGGRVIFEFFNVTTSSNKAKLHLQTTRVRSGTADGYGTIHETGLSVNPVVGGTAYVPVMTASIDLDDSDYVPGMCLCFSLKRDAGDVNDTFANDIYVVRMIFEYNY